MKQADIYFAVVAGSLEKYALIELESFGAKIISQVPRGIKFACDTPVLFKILYCSRLIQRVLLPLLNFPCHSIKYLHQQATRNIAWHSLFQLTETFGIDSNVSNSFTKHSLFAGQVLKDAICDSFRTHFGERPSYTNKEPDILFNLHIHDNFVTIALDIIGKSLHQRGYRKYSVEAPLQETLAAAIIQISGWCGDSELLDPMCGSGTLLAEALMHVAHIPSGYLRDNSRIVHAPCFEQTLWDSIVSSENQKIISVPRGLIRGSDQDERAVHASQQNLLLLPGGENILIEQARFQNIESKSGRTIITNPPYGVRLLHQDSAKRIYNELGDFLKQKCPSSCSYILCGDKELVKDIRLRSHWAKKLRNGNLDAQLAKIVVR